MTPGIILPVTEARAQLADLVNRVAYAGEQVTLTRHGRPVAALVSIQEAERIYAEPDPSPAELVSSPVVTMQPPKPLDGPDADYGVAAQTPVPPSLGGGRSGPSCY